MTHPLKAALGSPLYRKLLAIRLTGQAGDGMLQSALATFVLFSPERQASASAIAAAFAILALPYSLIGPFTGVFLDRWHRQRVLLTRTHPGRRRRSLRATSMRGSCARR